MCVVQNHLLPEVLKIQCKFIWSRLLYRFISVGMLLRKMYWFHIVNSHLKVILEVKRVAIHGKTQNTLIKVGVGNKDLNFYRHSEELLVINLFCLTESLFWSFVQCSPLVHHSFIFNMSKNIWLNKPKSINLWLKSPPTVTVRFKASNVHQIFNVVKILHYT